MASLTESPRSARESSKSSEIAVPLMRYSMEMNAIVVNRTRQEALDALINALSEGTPDSVDDTAELVLQTLEQVLGMRFVKRAWPPSIR